MGMGAELNLYRIKRAATTVLSIFTTAVVFESFGMLSYSESTLILHFSPQLCGILITTWVLILFLEKVLWEVAKRIPCSAKAYGDYIVPVVAEVSSFFGHLQTILEIALIFYSITVAGKYITGYPEIFSTTITIDLHYLRKYNGFVEIA